MRQTGPKHAKLPPVCVQGGVVQESLPLPFVHYPHHYGTFFAFSENADSALFLCECSWAVIENYIELMGRITAERVGQGVNLDNYPDLLRLPPPLDTTISLASGAAVIEQLHFRKAICHRCNLVPPTLRYCHEMYGVRFIQHFGWYVNQAYLRFGILGTAYLECLTPEEFIQDILAIRDAQAGLREAQQWFGDRDATLRLHISDPASNPPPATDYEEIARRQSILREAGRRARRAERALSKKIENIVREEFGFRKVGERWTSETLLCRIVSILFPDQQIITHHRPEWLAGLELDIHLPALNVAFEYQGQQHYHAIAAWGGEQALLGLKERDRRKAQLCGAHGIRLVTVDYTEPLTVDYIRGRVEEVYGTLNSTPAQ